MLQMLRSNNENESPSFRDKCRSYNFKYVNKFVYFVNFYGTLELDKKYVMSFSV